MTFLRTWLLGVVACAVLVSIAGQLAPDGAVRRAARFTGGMLLMLALLRPLLRLELSAPELDLNAFHDAAAQLEQELAARQSSALSARIAGETGAYIEDKADELGLSVCAEVSTREEEGVPVPAAVTLYGREDAALSALIARELGIAEEDQLWIGTEENGSAQ